jgi:predicted GIY-YIG superfamily endonuclease
VAHGGLKSYVGCTDDILKRLQKHNELEGWTEV